MIASTAQPESASRVCPSLGSSSSAAPVTRLPNRNDARLTTAASEDSVSRRKIPRTGARSTVVSSVTSTGVQTSRRAALGKLSAPCWGTGSCVTSGARCPGFGGSAGMGTEVSPVGVGSAASRTSSRPSGPKRKRVCRSAISDWRSASLARRRSRARRRPMTTPAATIPPTSPSTSTTTTAITQPGAPASVGAGIGASLIGRQELAVTPHRSEVGQHHGGVELNRG